ncbi:MAG: cupin domain-containing protein [Acidobacteriaceae bacterium]
MQDMTRRNLLLALPALAVWSNALADAQPADAEHSAWAHSHVFNFEQLPLIHSSGGAATRPVGRGILPTGEYVEMHETSLEPGQMPHPAHRHKHIEFMLIREGTVEFTANGKPALVGTGGIAYAASEELHGLKNTGSVPANYFVIAIGKE